MDFSITDDEYARKLIHQLTYNTPGMLPRTVSAAIVTPPASLSAATTSPIQSHCRQCQSSCGQTCQKQVSVPAPVCEQQCQQICMPVCKVAPAPAPEIKVTVQESALKSVNCQPSCENACNAQCVHLSESPNICGAACTQSCAKTCAPVVVNCLPPLTTGTCSCPEAYRPCAGKTKCCRQ
ncbi:hypothetical protein NECAME_06107 [Necator americanus]|uniref:Cysteine rich repeat-containing domain protein n=1 Tax=Necator americanus TaxID=51031 RepID=W2TYD2_NECAM|nr:hypothetical protein NECAME_06107 [Necator americanus]ETN86032.1 hypothetical protein NECAME_06107 [Necator americanus]